MANSTHRVEVFRVEKLRKHPNADTLNILTVFDNYQAVVRISDFAIGDLACYVPPDNVMPDRPEFEFLKNKRIKAQSFRGIMSQGLVLKAPPGTKEGEDVAEILGVTHYVPPEDIGGGGETIAGPPFSGNTYDIDSWFRYGNVLPIGTPVEITEKIHGANTRVSFQDGKFWAGSREHWRREDAKGMFWHVIHKNEWLKRLCEQNPDCIIYGESFGKVQKLKYGATRGEVWFRVFDILTPIGYMNHVDKIAALTKAAEGDWVPFHVPILFVGPYTPQLIDDFMSGNSVVPGANHLREGIVIKPLEEMWNEQIGRLVLKAVSPEYLAKDK